MPVRVRVLVLVVVLVVVLLLALVLVLLEFLAEVLREQAGLVCQVLLGRHDCEL